LSLAASPAVIMFPVVCAEIKLYNLFMDIKQQMRYWVVSSEENFAISKDVYPDTAQAVIDTAIVKERIESAKEIMKWLKAQL
jgi:hypothetical protein